VTSSSPRGGDPSSVPRRGASSASRSDYGVALQGVDPPADFAAMVREIESLDFGHLWVTDSSLHARNCYVYLTLAAVNSSRLRLGCTIPRTRFAIGLRG